MDLITLVFVGLSSSSGLGETPYHFVAGGSVTTRRRETRLELRYDSADKIESGSGWILAGDLDISGPSISYGGVGYRHRNGGPWTKHAVMLRLGVTPIRGLFLTVAQDVTTPNKSTSIEARVVGSLYAAIRTDIRMGLVRFDGGRYGYYAQTVLAIRLPYR